MHSWRIVQKGGRLERVRTNSSDDVCQTLETRLSIQVQILIWLTSEHGQHGGLLHGGREPWGAERGTFVSAVSLSLQISLAFLPGPVPGSCVGVGVVGLLCCWFLFLGKFVAISTNSSCWPTMSRTSPAMQKKNQTSHWSFHWRKIVPLPRSPENLLTQLFLLQRWCDRPAD